MASRKDVAFQFFVKASAKCCETVLAARTKCSLIHIIHALSVFSTFSTHFMTPSMQLWSSVIISTLCSIHILCNIFDFIIKISTKNHHYHCKTLGHSHASKYQSTQCFWHHFWLSHRLYHTTPIFSNFESLITIFSEHRTGYSAVSEQRNDEMMQSTAEGWLGLQCFGTCYWLWQSLWFSMSHFLINISNRSRHFAFYG
jgi:hypothetical protein